MDPRFKNFPAVFIVLLALIIIGGIFFQFKTQFLIQGKTENASKMNSAQLKDTSSEGSHKMEGSHKKEGSHIEEEIKSDTHEDGHKHDASGETIDHNDPKNQKRMGIFHFNEGNKFLRKGDWQQAVKNYEMSLRHDKNISEVYINLSTALLQGNQFNDVLKTLRTLEEKEPQNPFLHYNFACYYSRIGSIDSGFQSLRKAIDLGLKNKKQILTDIDLENLRNDPRFKREFDL